jgi:hypothetical protein
MLEAMMGLLRTRDAFEMESGDDEWKVGGKETGGGEGRKGQLRKVVEARIRATQRLKRCI